MWAHLDRVAQPPGSPDRADFARAGVEAPPAVKRQHPPKIESAQTMNLPLFKIFLGSIACLTAFINARSVGVEPHASRYGLASFGQWATSADDPGGNSARNAATQFENCAAGGGSTGSGMKATARFPVAARPSTAGIKLFSVAARSSAWMAGATSLRARCVYITMALRWRPSTLYSNCETQRQNCFSGPPSSSPVTAAPSSRR